MGNAGNTRVRQPAPRPPLRTHNSSNTMSRPPPLFHPTSSLAHTLTPPPPPPTNCTTTGGVKWHLDPQHQHPTHTLFVSNSTASVVAANTRSAVLHTPNDCTATCTMEQ